MTTQTIWVCPSESNCIFHEKGKCPYCDKELIPYIPASVHEDAVKLLDEAYDLIIRRVLDDKYLEPWLQKYQEWKGKK